MDAAASHKPLDPRPVPGGPASVPARMGDRALREIHESLARDKEEPAVGFAPIPIVLIFLLSALIIWGSLYVANHSGGFQWEISDDGWRPGATIAAPPKDPMVEGLKIYKGKGNCLNCHGPEGKGQPGTYPPLAGSPWVVGNPDRVISLLLSGMNGSVEIMGNTYSGSMPAVRDNLKDAEIAYVLTYVRQAWGNGAPAVDESRVAELRAQLGNRNPFTPQELLQKHPLEDPATLAAPPAPAATTGQ